MRVVSTVLPFQVNDYVDEELIDWSTIEEDPIFRLTFPHRDMLPSQIFSDIAELVDAGAPRDVLNKAGAQARRLLNPHPGGQIDSNIPVLQGKPALGLQHKYRETVLVFPSQGQTCHAYCGYCFRWASSWAARPVRLSRTSTPWSRTSGITQRSPMSCSPGETR